MDRRLPERDRSVPQIIEDSHLTEDALEVYSLGRMSLEEDLATVEEHLLVCAYCQSRLEKVDEFSQSVVEGAKRIATNPKPSQFRNYLPMAIAASAGLMFFIPGFVENGNEATKIDLAAVRNEAKNMAPAGKTLDLKPDLTGLEATAFDWELSGPDGKLKANGKLDLVSGRLAVKGLNAGQYWLRLKAAGQPDVLREFSLLVK